MSIITRPRCDASFETQATTATRCRSCRSVVHVGRSVSPARHSDAAAPALRSVSRDYEDDGESLEPLQHGGPFMPLGLVVIAASVTAWWWRKRRGTERGAEPPAPDNAPRTDMPEVSQLPEPDLARCPRCTTGTARCGVAGCPMEA